MKMTNYRDDHNELVSYQRNYSIFYILYIHLLLLKYIHLYAKKFIDDVQNVNLSGIRMLTY